MVIGEMWLRAADSFRVSESPSRKAESRVFGRFYATNQGARHPSVPERRGIESLDRAFPAPLAVGPLFGRTSDRLIENSPCPKKVLRPHGSSEECEDDDEGRYGMARDIQAQGAE